MNTSPSREVQMSLMRKNLLFLAGNNCNEIAAKSSRTVDLNSLNGRKRIVWSVGNCGSE